MISAAAAASHSDLQLLQASDNGLPLTHRTLTFYPMPASEIGAVFPNEE